MAKHEHLYLKLMEECAEVQQRASKLLQFGSEEAEPGQCLTNAMRLRQEINDLLTIIDMIEQAGFPMNRGEDLELHMAEKREKIAKYLQYSQKLGRVDFWDTVRPPIATEEKHK
jgi:uncharacterized protein YaaN involved in tellurite resistance